ncbi:MAG: DUF1559 domain-containing protein [Planctomycetales bacterium]|nr:DUF1559 domain-containing protein [Planctomycetales bacterium]
MVGNRKRRAFTLIELMVSLAIVSAMVGALLPAVQNARESARRTQCLDRLRQIGSAMHQHHGAQKSLPAGYRSSPTSDGLAPGGVLVDPQTWDAGPGWGWAAQILPYLEQAPMFDALHIDLPVWDAKNLELVAVETPTFLCPSSASDAGTFLVRNAAGDELNVQGVPVALARSHYVASHGQESCWGECGAAATAVVFTDIYRGATRRILVEGDASRVADGPFFRNSRTRFKQISDGLSQTLFIGEHTPRLSDKAWGGVVPGAVVHPRLQTPENGPDAAATLVLVHGGPSGGELDITGFPIIHPVNFPTMHVGQMASDHPGGGNVCLGDASARFVGEDVNLFTWAELSSMNEGEVAGVW